MLNKIFQKAMGFLQQPTKAFDAESKTVPMEAFVYMAVLSIVGAVLGGIISIFTLPGGGFMVGATIIGGYIGGIVVFVIAGLWLHLWAYIFGAKKGLNQTLKTVFYGLTPFYLFGWIPTISILFLLWSLYLQWTGLQRLHGMPGDRAAFAVVIAIIIPIIIMVVLMAAAIYAFGVFGPATYTALPGFDFPT